MNDNNWNNNKISISSSIVTIVLIAVNVVIWLYLALKGDTESAQYMYEHGALYPDCILENGEYWRFFTSSFLHFGIIHLSNNMLVLACAGPYLEHALGHVRYLLLYILAALGSSGLSYYMMLTTGDYAVSAGASGAIFGVIAGLLWVVIRHKGKYETLTTRGMVFMIFMTLYYGISTAGVDNWGHVGGMLSGFVVCILLYRKNK